jgi:hypothetical protein
VKKLVLASAVLLGALWLPALTRNGNYQGQNQNGNGGNGGNHGVPGPLVGAIAFTVLAAIVVWLLLMRDVWP